MNPFIESTLAQPLQGAAAQWQAQGEAPGQARAGGASARGQRFSPMSRFLRRRPRAAAPDGQRHGAQGAGLKRLASGAVMALGLMLAGSGQAWAVDVNRATPEELQTVRGIGPKTAQAIVDERTRGGGFESFDDLSERVKGIGAKKVQSLQSAGLTLSGRAAAAEAPAKKPAAAR